MKRFRGWFLAVIPCGIAFMLACGSSGVDNPGEVTNEDAIRDIIKLDEPQSFEIDMMDTTTADTSMLLGGPYVVRHFWRRITQDSIYIDIAFQPPADSLGAVPYANVQVQKFVWGRLEVMATDTTGGGSTPVRFSKPFRAEGFIDAVFEQVGGVSDPRRGWKLSRISDVSIGRRNTYVRTITVVPGNHPDSTLYPFGPPYSILGRDQLYTYAPSESVTVRVQMNSSYELAHVTLKYPTNGGIGFVHLDPDSSGEYLMGFRMPNIHGFGHFLIDVVSKDAVTYSDSTINAYLPAGGGVLFKLPY